MAITVTHTTPADDSFSAAGALAWDANHSLTGVGTMAEQNANNVAITGGTMSGVAITGYVTAVTATGPISSTGGTTPNLSMPAASTSLSGYLTNTDWNTFNNKQPAGAYLTAVTADAPLSGSGTANSHLIIAQSNSTTDGYLSATDWNIFNNKGSGDVVGPSSATDNAIARFDTTTGKLIQNSVVTIGDTGAVTGVTTLSASTSVSTPIVKATSSAGGALQNASGNSQIQWGAGGGDNVTIDVSANLNGTNAQIDISPTGTGHVHIKPTGSGSIEIAPTNAGTMNNMVIGGTTPLAGAFTSLVATSGIGGGAF